MASAKITQPKIDVKNIPFVHRILTNEENFDNFCNIKNKDVKMLNRHIRRSRKPIISSPIVVHNEDSSRFMAEHLAWAYRQEATLELIEKEQGYIIIREIPNHSRVWIFLCYFNAQSLFCYRFRASCDHSGQHIVSAKGRWDFDFGTSEMYFDDVLQARLVPRYPDSENSADVLNLIMNLLTEISTKDIELKQVENDSKREPGTKRECLYNVLDYSNRVFTEINRDKPFNVRTHERRMLIKQKDGTFAYEMRTIKAYVKKGYHRLADVVLQNLK